METTFTFRNLEATDGLKTHTEEKLHKLDKYQLRVEAAHVILSVENHDHCAEITLTKKGDALVGHSKSDDMYASIDQAIRKLATQLQRTKERIQNHKGSGRPSDTDGTA